MSEFVLERTSREVTDRRTGCLRLFANSGDVGECVTTELRRVRSRSFFFDENIAFFNAFNPDFFFVFSKASRGLTWRSSDSDEVSCCDGKVGSDCCTCS